MKLKNCGAMSLLIVGFLAGTAAAQVSGSRVSGSRRTLVAARKNWQQGARAAAQGNTADLRARAIAQKMRARSLRSANASGVGGQWSSPGPTPLPSDASGIGLQDYSWIAGRATAVVVDPNDSTGNTVFIGGANGGVWKSTNAGPASQIPGAVAWTPLTDNEATLAIGALAVQPQTSNPNPATSVVLAGTGETNSSADAYYGLGILRSADGGQTWTLIPQDVTGAHPFAGIGFSGFAFSDFNPSVVVAGTGSASEGVIEALENPLGPNRGIYYSTDAGVTWNAANVADLGTPINPSSVTAVAYNAAAAKFYAAVRNHGFYASFDGINWLRLATQPGAGMTAAACPTQAVQPSACPIYRGEIAVVPNRAGPNGVGEMYVWYTDANDVDQGIWQSLDGGFSWTQINDSGISNCGDLLGGCGAEFASDNLTLAAVPNGAATDLYAGAVNLYKCSITSASPLCNGVGSNGFINLTHVYGCSDIAKVYPGQHAIDFAVTGGSALLYFANDGGVYRALDGYTGLTTGTCGLTNQFDSLNATLGPMTQFVSLAQSSSNANLAFGGTTENGAPATSALQSANNWANVNAGNVGATAINPSNDNEWFLSAPPDSVSGVNLFRCANGVNCHTQDFATDEVADSVALGGDTGGFRLPFILDPHNSSSLLAGTCKIWRGPSAGGTFTLLSPDFENGGTGVCSGSETNLVRAIAAGGPVDANGDSQVIYAGTNSFGPLVSVTPSGGHVWVTTNANGGPASWTDETRNINPSNFPISSIAIDVGDRTGQTAYVGIMGFGVSHLWKTTNAGTSWMDFTGGLPDAPVDAITIDSNAGTIYVGTDVGVFASSTASPGWSEVGPATGPGFLPEVAVTALQIFSASGIKQLRAATSGRGLWEWNLITTADFQISVANTPQTIFPGQSAIYSGTITASNGYNSTVNLSCTAGSTSTPQTCTVTPNSVTPNAPVQFSINATGLPGDYSFNLHAVGTDPQTVAHDFPLMLHVVDFALSAPSPTTLNVAQGATSSPVSLTVSAAGSFSGQVTLACSGLPANTLCNFQPSNVVSPTSASPVALTLTIATSANTPTGGFPVTISAAATGLATQTQNLTLNVNASPDYTLTISNPSLTGQPNAPAVFNGTLTAVNGYSSAVTPICGAGAPPTCTPNPASVVPTAAGAPFTVTVSSGVAQAYAFNIDGVGTDPAATAHSAAVTFTAIAAPDYTLTISNTPLTSNVNAPASFTGTLTAINGYSSAVTLSCGAGGPPSCPTVSVAPSPAGTPFSVTVSSSVSQAYAFNIVAVGSDAVATTHSAPVNFTALPAQSFDFKLSITPPSVTVPAGNSALYTLDVSPSTGTFPNNVTYNCSGLPALTTCTFNPAQIAAGAGDSTITLTVATTAAVPAARLTPALWLGLPLAGLFLLPIREIKSKRRFAGMCALIAFVAISNFSCSGGLQGNSTGGGSGSPGTPAGSYSVNVNVSTTSVSHSVQANLTVTP